MDPAPEPLPAPAISPAIAPPLLHDEAAALAFALGHYHYRDPALRDAVCSYARWARAAGRPRDRMVLGIIVLLREHGIPRARPEHHAALRARVVRWAVDAYQRGD
jgi:hypothetical protein